MLELIAANKRLRIILKIPKMLVDVACRTFLNGAFNEGAVGFKGELNLIGVGVNELE